MIWSFLSVQILFVLWKNIYSIRIYIIYIYIWLYISIYSITWYMTPQQTWPLECPVGFVRINGLYRQWNLHNKFQSNGLQISTVHLESWFPTPQRCWPPKIFGKCGKGYKMKVQNLYFWWYWKTTSCHSVEMSGKETTMFLRRIPMV